MTVLASPPPILNLHFETKLKRVEGVILSKWLEMVRTRHEWYHVIPDYKFFQRQFTSMLISIICIKWVQND